MTNIRSIDMLLLDDIFEMHGGYVLNFSDRTFAKFFAEELNIDIGDLRYALNGTSKAKRLRCFLQTVDKPTVVRTLNALWEYREIIRQRADRLETLKNPYGNLLTIINRLSGNGTSGTAEQATPAKAHDSAKFAEFQSNLLSLTQLAPQARGYAFENF
jgi:hypothetical protein